MTMPSAPVITMPSAPVITIPLVALIVIPASAGEKPSRRTSRTATDLLALIWIEAETEVPSKLSPQSGISAQSVNRWIRGVLLGTRLFCSGFLTVTFTGEPSPPPALIWPVTHRALKSVLHSSWKSRELLLRIHCD